MFYDGVFDNLDGMKFVSPGECPSHGGMKFRSHSGLRTYQVPIEMFMDYVPDIAAFKVLNFKGADSYLCVVSAMPSFSAAAVERVANAARIGQAQADEAVLRAAIRRLKSAHGPRSVCSSSGPVAAFSHMLIAIPLS